MPQNYLVAQKINNRWIVDPDNSADKQLCLIVFEITNSGYYRKYELSGDELIKEINSKIDRIKKDFFTRLPNDYNGNPRYCIHFLQCMPDVWKEIGVTESYKATCKLMNKLGGRKYHTKNYGGGIVFSTYGSLVNLYDDIQKLKDSVLR